MGLPPPPAPRPPGWLRAATVLAWLWMAGWAIVSWASSLGVSCSDPGCQDRADTGWLLLTGLQLAWIVAAAVLSRRPAWRRWALAVAVLLPPATFFAVTQTMYPPGYSL